MHDLLRPHYFCQLTEVAPVAFIDPVVDFFRTDDLDSLDVLFQESADPGANRARGPGVAIFVGRRWAADDDDPFLLEGVALGRHDVAALPDIDSGGDQ